MRHEEPAHLRNKGKRAKKDQSAMEYLMTYGWAILIIAVVLGVMYYIGVFNGAYFAPKLPPGSCQVIRPGGIDTTQNINTEGECLNGLPEYVAQMQYTSNLIFSNSQLTPGNSFTWSVWVDEFSPSAATEMPLGELGGWTGIYLWHSGDYFTVQPSPGGCATTIAYSNKFVSSGWTNYAATYNGVIMTLYVNGAAVSSNTLVGSVGCGNTGLGSGPTGIWALNSYPFAGQIANVQIYNSTFDANTVQYLYDEGIGGVPQELSSLVAWWPLDGNTNDYSGNLNNAVSSTNVIFTTSWIIGYSAP